MIEGIQELWAQMPSIESRIRAMLPFPTEGAWTWVAGLAAFTFIVTVPSLVVGKAAEWLARLATQK